MAAEDAFEWAIASMAKDPSPETQRYIASLREYMFSLRSEDERQRFVDEVIERLRHLDTLKRKH